jgi:hypothetical protein
MEWLIVFFQIFMYGKQCNSTVFGYPSDPNKGGTARCIKRYIKAHELGVAHRSLACGRKVALYNPRTQKTAVAVVVDRGPYGAKHEGEWVLKRRHTEPGKWRGCLDLTTAVAKQLGHNGFEKVFYYPIKEKRPSQEKAASDSILDYFYSFFGPQPVFL